MYRRDVPTIYSSIYLYLAVDVNLTLSMAEKEMDLAQQRQAVHDQADWDG